ncbi:MAG: 2-hydroxyacid dehydrogenase [Halothece sp.]
MKVALFGTKPYDEKFFNKANETYNHDLIFLEPHLSEKTAILAQDATAICVFVNDEVRAETLKILARQGVKLIALRCAGYNNVDLETAKALGMQIVRVPAYSPHAVAEHAIALILTLNRKIHRAYNRIREGNFSLNGLLGFDLYGRTVGIIGTGKIGYLTGQILSGFGCKVLAYDPYPNESFSNFGEYVSLDEVYARSDIISLHCPLTEENRHLINQDSIAKMKPGVMLINTSRGGLIDTKAVITGLKSKIIGYLALDVYEEESDLFFEDLSNEVIEDDIFQRLLTFPNVVITGHQAFFTEEALTNIAQTTLANITEIETTNTCQNLAK